MKLGLDAVMTNVVIIVIFIEAEEVATSGSSMLISLMEKFSSYGTYSSPRPDEMAIVIGVLVKFSSVYAKIGIIVSSKSKDSPSVFHMTARFSFLQTNLKSST